MVSRRSTSGTTLLCASRHKNRVCRFETQEAGEEALQKWIVDHLYSPTPAVRSIAKTIVQWQEPIQHYFSFRVTNAKIEGTHNKVKVIKRRAYGYRNLERFKIRIRLECKPAT